MSGVLAARMGDQVGHDQSLLGGILGALAGVAIAAVAVVAIVGTGGAALVVIAGAVVAGGAGGALGGMHIGEAYDGPICVSVSTGSENTLIEKRRAARAGIDVVPHSDELVGEGSKRVYVNQRPLARIGDKCTCGGKIRTACTKTIVSEETARGIRKDGTEISDEDLEEWGTTKKWLTYAMWGGIALMTGGTAAIAYAGGATVMGAIGGALIQVGRPIAQGMIASMAVGWGARTETAKSLGVTEAGARWLETGAGLGAGFLGMKSTGNNAKSATSALDALSAKWGWGEAVPGGRVPGGGRVPAGEGPGGGKPAGEGPGGGKPGEGPGGGKPAPEGEVAPQPIKDLELPPYTRNPGEQLTVDPNVQTGTRVGQSGKVETTLLAKESPIEIPARITEPLKPAAELTGGKGDRFMVRREGFDSKPEFNRMAQEAVEAAQARIKNGEIKTLDELMTDLAARRAEIARQMKDPQADQFGVRRTYDPANPLEAYTPLSNRYAYAYGRAFAEGPITAKIGGETVPMTEPTFIPGSPAWKHTSPQNIPSIMKHVEGLYTKAMDPTLPVEQTVATVAEIHYYLAQAMPFNRGSAAVTDMVTKSIFDARGISTSPTKPGRVIDIEALVTKDAATFVKNYGNNFEVPPGGGGAPKPGQPPTVELPAYTRSPGEQVVTNTVPKEAPPPGSPPVRGKEIGEGFFSKAWESTDGKFVIKEAKPVLKHGKLKLTAAETEMVVTAQTKASEILRANQDQLSVHPEGPRRLAGEFEVRIPETKPMEGEPLAVFQEKVTGMSREEVIAALRRADPENARRAEDRIDDIESVIRDNANRMLEKEVAAGRLEHETKYDGKADNVRYELDGTKVIVKDFDPTAVDIHALRQARVRERYERMLASRAERAKEAAAKEKTPPAEETAPAEGTSKSAGEDAPTGGGGGAKPKTQGEAEPAVDLPEYTRAPGEKVATSTKPTRTPEELEALAKDPAHNGKITPGSLQERAVALEMEAAGQPKGIKGPVTRDPNPKGADFIDGDGAPWDVKGFRSTTDEGMKIPPRKGGFTPKRAADKITDTLAQGDKVIVDTTKMTPEEVTALKAELTSRNVPEESVKWYPPN